MKKIQKNEGFTLIELLIVVAIIGIIAAIAVPGLLRARQSGNEASAIGSVGALNSAQATFAASCGGGGYAQSLAGLSTPPPQGVPFISPDLSLANVAPGKSGYFVDVDNGGLPALAVVVVMQMNTCNNVANSLTDFVAASWPITVGTTGQRSFGSDARGTIFQNSAGAQVTQAQMVVPPVAPVSMLQ